MQFRILGPLEVAMAGRTLSLGRSRADRTLAALLLDANRLVPVDRLIGVVWDDPPPTARKLLQNAVSTLRGRLVDGGVEADLLRSDSAGYSLRLAAGQLDLHDFQDRVAGAQRRAAAGDVAGAVDPLRAALALWRGPALASLPGRVLRGRAASLDEVRMTVWEECFTHELALGRHLELIGELSAAVAAHPLRERLVGQLMVALHRSGRRSEALDAFRRLRERLAEELGLDPGAAVCRLHEAVLRADPALDLREPEKAPGGTRPVPAQLPADAAGFTGRTGHLDQLDALLSASRSGATSTVVVSVIGGAAGVGKTALAVHWAHRVGDRFPDGTLYVNLRGHASTSPMQPLEALVGFLHALGVAAEQVPVDLDRAAALYRTLLAGRRVLAVLDNAASAEQVRPLLPGTGGCLVLVTSRNRLAGLVASRGAVLVTLDVLTATEAEALLAGLGGAERSAAEPGALSELARLCAYLPLALRIAAANLICQPGRTIAAHVAELSAGDRLTTLQIDEDEETAVRGAFNLSYAALPADARRLFRLLGLVPGADLTVPAAAALAGTTVTSARRLLSRLAAAHLLDEHTTGRYTFHDLLRLYAAERAHEEDDVGERAAATDRLLGWYLSMADAAARLLHPEMVRLPSPVPAPDEPPFATPEQALAWLDSERNNLTATVRDVKAAADRPVWLLADRLRGYFWLRMYTVDWLTVAAAALSAAEAAGDRHGQAAAELSLGDVYSRRSLYPQAIEHYTRALDMNRETGWHEAESAVLCNLGNVYWWWGRLTRAADHYRQALALARRIGRVSGQAIHLANLGAVYWELGELAQAADHHGQALALDRQVGSRFGEAVDLCNLGELYLELGRLDDAADRVTEGLALHRQIGNRGGEAEALRILSAVHRDAGRYDDAQRLANAATALADDTGNHRIQADSLNTLASIDHRLGRCQQALRGHQRAMDLARESTTPYPEMVALIGMAAVHLDLRANVPALTLAQQAVGASQAGYRLLEGQARTVVAAVHLADGHLPESVDEARRALDVHRATGHRLGEARTLVVLGHASNRLGDQVTAAGRWRQALDLFTEIGSPEAGQARTLVDRADIGPALG